ncbi:MAG: outer membrane protein assembly factor BamA [Deltaproteobacteria bacterium]|nr:outer membrane protein assembly factor BamA [Deltaproteobacteria bacterium]
MIKVCGKHFYFIVPVLFSLVFFAAAPSLAGPRQIKEVKVAGNDRIEEAAILRVVKVAAGDEYDKKVLSDDLTAIYNMGYFNDVRVSVDKAADGVTVVFTVSERPTVRDIEFTGNAVFKDDKLKENVDISAGSILNINSLKRNVTAIETLYKDKNYHNVSVKYKIHEIEHNQADIEFIIKEGKKVYIKEIILDGNHAYTDKELKKKMETDEKGFFSFFTSSGDLKTEDLSQDIVTLSDFYHDTGFADARVSDPDIRFDGNWIYITIKIDEGPRYAVGKVDFTGDLIFDKKELYDRIAIDSEPFFNQKVLRADVLTLSDMYADKGFARADIYPDIQRDMKKKSVDIRFNLRKNKPVYFEKIIIEGNTKTRDKVIRRELSVFEQARYNATKLKRSVRNLYRLDFFENIDVKTRRGSADDQMILDIGVTEKATGAFSFGAGYSAIDKLYVMASVSERNFFGRGQLMQFKIQTGSQAREYSFSFTEPWLFDIPLSAGINLYSWQRDYNEYDRHSKGGQLRFGYPLFDYTRGYLSYAFDASSISNVDAAFQYLIDDGTLTESSVTAELVYDSRDKAINTTEGSRHQVSLQYAGMGGNVGFIKALAEAGHYFPLFWHTVFFLHGEAGYVDQLSGKQLPDYEKFYLGGINSLRGFDWRGVSAYDSSGNQVGGDKYVQFNAEFVFPVIRKAEFMGLVFYDTGNVYSTGDKFDIGGLRKSAGFGIRWYSPMGPIRLERGYILDRKKNAAGEYIENKGRWEFSIGGAFD